MTVVVTVFPLNEVTDKEAQATKNQYLGGCCQDEIKMWHMNIEY